MVSKSSITTQGCIADAIPSRDNRKNGSVGAYAPTEPFFRDFLGTLRCTAKESINLVRFVRLTNISLLLVEYKRLDF